MHMMREERLSADCTPDIAIALAEETLLLGFAAAPLLILHW